MCTAVSFYKNDHYFGRSLDYDRYFGEEVAIAPRNFMFDFRFAGIMREHYAMIGMAHVAENVPLYYDCVNEKGLAMAGLNFVGNAFFGEPSEGKYALAPHEFIPFILGQCRDLSEAPTRAVLSWWNPPKRDFLSTMIPLGYSLTIPSSHSSFCS